VVEYSYKLTDFPNDVMDSGRFAAEIRNSNITASMLYMKTRGQNITIFFDTDLSGAEQTTLDGLVAAHIGIPYNSIGNSSVISDTVDSTSSTSYQQKLTLPLNNIAGGKYVVLWSASIQCSAQGGVKTRVQQNDSETLSELDWTPTADGFAPVSGFVELTLSVGDHHFDFDFAASKTNKSVSIRKARLLIMRN